MGDTKKIKEKKRELKKWNGRGWGKYDRGHFNVAAYSQKQAAELIGKAAGFTYPLGVSEIRNYYSQCWGNDMNNINPKAPGVWVTHVFGPNCNKPPKKVI